MNKEKIIASLLFHNKVQVDSYPNIRGNLFETNYYKSYISFLVGKSNIVGQEKANKAFSSINIDTIGVMFCSIEEAEELLKNKDIGLLFDVFFVDSAKKKLNNSLETIKNNNIADPAETAIAELESAKEFINSSKTSIYYDINGYVDDYERYMDETLKSRDADILNISGITGLSSGFNSLDNLTKGFKPGDYIMVAGRPSMGKTALGLDFTKNALGKNKVVLFFSVEMPSYQIMARLISKINPELSLDNSLHFKDYSKKKGLIKEAATYLKEIGLALYDFSDQTPTIETIKKVVDQTLRERGRIDLVVLDYIQLLSSSINSYDENTIIANSSKQIKALAKKTNAPWVVLSQLNRQVENRADKRPTMADLRGSGALEQDADIILFPFRPNVYLLRELAEKAASTEKEGAKRAFLEAQALIAKNSDIEVAEINVVKNRNGEIGVVELEYEKKRVSFLNPNEGVRKKEYEVYNIEMQDI